MLVQIQQSITESAQLKIHDQIHHNVWQDIKKFRLIVQTNQNSINQKTVSAHNFHTLLKIFQYQTEESKKMFTRSGQETRYLY